jgi:hypothetical protein
MKEETKGFGPNVGLARINRIRRHNRSKTERTEDLTAKIAKTDRKGFRQDSRD